MTRAEHLAWAKRRAFEYVEIGELNNAVISLLSDLGKFEGDPPLVDPQRNATGWLLMLVGADALAVGAWIHSIK